MNAKKSRYLVPCGLSPLFVICMMLPSLAKDWVGARERIVPWSRDGGADRLRMGVRTEGLYTVTAEEVATAMGVSLSSVVFSFSETNIWVSCQGESVPCSVVNDQLFFSGVPAFAQRAPENVYWLELNTGRTPPVLPPEPAPTNSWKLGTMTLQGTNEVSYCTVGMLTNLPSYLAFRVMPGGTSFSVTNTWVDGVTNSIPGELSVTLLSYASGETFPHSHQASISVNGTDLGTPAWNDEAYMTFTYSVPGHLLTNGVAVVTVKNILPSSVNVRFFWTKLALTMAKRTDVERPVLRPSLRGVRDSDGTAADDVADYVVVIPPEGWVLGFRETIAPLVTLRAKQGLRTAIMDVESLYNRFTHGLADPEAVRAFCRQAYASPTVPLKYLLLAGSGSFDFNHERISVTDYNACLIPTLIASQRFPNKEAMLVAMDQAFGDVTGNAAPEIAVGRYPTAWTQELAVAVAKALAYEESMSWKGVAAVSAGSAFVNDMNIVKEPLEIVGKTLTNCYPAKLTTWNNTLKTLFQQGVGSFWFIGHSTTTSFGEGTSETDKLLDITRLKNTSWSKKPIAILMGCHLNLWHALNIPMPDAASLGPFSVFRSGSGFSAVFASTGYAWDGEYGVLGETQRLALYLSECSGSNGIYRIGDAILAAEQRLALYDPIVNENLPNSDPAPIPPERLQSYSLVGCPAMMWRHDYAATGTPVSWLASHGLTAWNGDISDSDGDGWLAWQEYQAGTQPATNQFVIAKHAFDPSKGSMRLTFETKANKSYRVMWKYSLESAEPWEPLSWSWGGDPETFYQALEQIVPVSPMSQINIPMRPGDTQGFYRIQQVD